MQTCCLPRHVACSACGLACSGTWPAAARGPQRCNEVLFLVGWPFGNMLALRKHSDRHVASIPVLLSSWLLQMSHAAEANLLFAAKAMLNFQRAFTQGPGAHRALCTGSFTQGPGAHRARCTASAMDVDDQFALPAVALLSTPFRFPAALHEHCTIYLGEYVQSLQR